MTAPRTLLPRRSRLARRRTAWQAYLRALRRWRRGPAAPAGAATFGWGRNMRAPATAFAVLALAADLPGAEVALLLAGVPWWIHPIVVVGDLVLAVWMLGRVAESAVCPHALTATHLYVRGHGGVTVALPRSDIVEARAAPRGARADALSVGDGTGKGVLVRLVPGYRRSEDEPEPVEWLRFPADDPGAVVRSLA